MREREVIPAVKTNDRYEPNRALMRRRKVIVGERHSEYQLLSLTRIGIIVRDVESGKGSPDYPAVVR